MVEDEDRIARFLAKGLRTQGYEVDCVGTGAEALARATADKAAYDLAVLDLGLPDLDGLDVLRGLRERGVLMPVIVLTARTEPTDRAQASELGASDYLLKPVPFGEFLGRVRERLEPSLPA